MPTHHTSTGALVAGEARIASASPQHQFLARAQGLLSGLEALAPLGAPQAEAATFLASWCLELTLKAHLASRGQGKTDLQSVQHNLSALWAKAFDFGLPVTAAPPHWCVILSSTHDKPFYQRYPTDAAGSIAPNIEALVVELNRLHSVVAQSIR